MGQSFLPEDYVSSLPSVRIALACSYRYTDVVFDAHDCMIELHSWRRATHTTIVLSIFVSQTESPFSKNDTESWFSGTHLYCRGVVRTYASVL